MLQYQQRTLTTLWMKMMRILVFCAVAGNHKRFQLTLLNSYRYQFWPNIHQNHWTNRFSDVCLFLVVAKLFCRSLCVLLLFVFSFFIYKFKFNVCACCARLTYLLFSLFSFSFGSIWNGSAFNPRFFFLSILYRFAQYNDKLNTLLASIVHIQCYFGSSFW